MKNFTFIVASAMLMVSAQIEAQTVARHIAQSLVHNMKYRQATKQSLIKPQTVREYTYSDIKRGWVESSLHEFTYDKIGNTLTLKSTTGKEVDLTMNQWDENNQNTLSIGQTSEDGGKTYENSSKKVQEFDKIVPTLVVYKNKYSWENGEWQETGDSFRRAIDRDANGNITKLEVLTPYMGDMDATQRYTFIYDPETKQATEYKFEELGYEYESNSFYWQTSEYLTDLKWKETNGQLYGQYDEWMETGNKLLSATLAYEEKGEVKSFGNINVEYKDDGKGFMEVAQYTDEPEKVVTELTYTDQYGSLVYTATNYTDLNSDGVYTDDEITGQSRQTVTYNEHGDCELEQYEELSEEGTGLEIVAATKYVYTYDPEYPDEAKEYTVTEYDYDKKMFSPSVKFVTEKFVDVVAGINDAPASTIPAATTVYNLQGMKLSTQAANSGKGLMIVKRGGKTYKVAR